MALHLAPSAARSIPMPGSRAPVPLRSHKEPDGLSTLSGISLVRVSVANTLYKATAQIITFAFQHGILWSCENPNRSLFWATSAMKVLQGIPHIETRTHHCMFGSQRRKHTLFVHAIPQLQSVGILCDDSHEHLPWEVLPNGQFATHAEVAYPPLLCKAMAAAFRQQIILLGASAPATSIVCSPLPLHQAAQIATSTQRKKRNPPLVPEFARRILVRASSSCLPTSSTLTADFILPAEATSVPPCKVIPAGSKRVSYQMTHLAPVHHLTFRRMQLAHLTPVHHLTFRMHLGLQHCLPASLLCQCRQGTYLPDLQSLHLSLLQCQTACLLCRCHRGTNLRLSLLQCLTACLLCRCRRGTFLPGLQSQHCLGSTRCP